LTSIQSKLTVASDKTRGKLGNADLDLSQFGKGEFNEMILPLNDCQYENSYIVVGLKGVETQMTPRSKAKEAAEEGLNTSAFNLM
jgi:hypothetical protein